MKRFLTVWAVACATVTGVFASPVSLDQAKALAQVWACENATFASGGDAVSAFAVCDTNQAKTVLWYQVSLSGGGCLMVAPDTEIEPVLAALDADPGVLPAAHPLRGILSADVRTRLRMLGLYPEDGVSHVQTRGGAGVVTGVVSRPGAPVAPVAEQQKLVSAWRLEQDAKWGRLLAKAAQRETSSVGVADPIPLEIGIVDGFEKDGRFTHWNQGNGGGGFCYNLYTPEHAVCGCVATAAAAMMQFFGVEAVLPYVNPKCTYKGKPYNTMFKTDAATMQSEDDPKIYDWSLFEELKTRKDYDKLTEEQREVLGRLAFDAGVCFGMMWSPSESGAYTEDMAQVMCKQFQFASARCVSNPQASQYSKLIYAQIRAGAPVGMGIKGHAVVAVGYGRDQDNVERVRVFMGWGGSGDAWYALPNIDTMAVMGENSYLSTEVNCVITMINRESDAVVPVVGQVLPSVDADIVCGDVTVKPNANGYFGARVSVAQAGKVNVTCGDKTMSVVVGEDAKPTTEGGFAYKGDAVCAQVPDEIMFLLINSESASSVADAKEKALASGKPMLFFSGVSGEGPSDSVWNIIKWLDDNNVDGFCDKFVIAYFPWNPAAYSPSDGRPSYGVFDPEIYNGASEEHWAFYNGRLAWDDFVDFNTSISDGVTNFTATAEGTNALYAVLYGGLLQYQKNRSGVTLEVVTVPEGVLASSDGDAEAWIRGVPGSYTNCLVAGEESAFAFAETVTNETAGVIYRCMGWTLSTNETVVAEGSGATGAFVAESNTTYVLCSSWAVEQVRVTAAFESVDGGAFVPGSITPEFVWAAPGSEVSFTANVNATKYKFVDWLLNGVEVGTSATLTYALASDVAGKVAFTAVVQGVQRYALAVSSTPAALQGRLGETPTPGYDTRYWLNGVVEASMTPAVVTNASDKIVWCCQGADFNGISLSGNNVTFSLVEKTGSKLTWQWAIDLAATLALKGWDATDPVKADVTMGALPEGMDPAQLEIVNVPEGWSAELTVDDGGQMVETMTPTEDWPSVNLGVALTVVHTPDLSDLVSCAVSTSSEGKLVVEAPSVVTNLDEGVVYVPVSWYVTGDVTAEGMGPEAVFAAASGNAVTLTWQWNVSLYRINAEIKPYNYTGLLISAGSFVPEEAWVAPGESALFAYVPDHAAHQGISVTLAGWSCSAADNWSHEGLTATATAVDGPVTLTAELGLGKQYYLTIAGVDQDGNAVAYGSPTPAYSTEKSKSWNDLMYATMADAVVTNSDEVVYFCTGWKLVDDKGTVEMSGEGTNAEFRLEAVNNTFTWLWTTNSVPEEPGPKPRDPAVPPLGPEGSSPLMTGDGATQVTIANAISGWWYGVYTTTSLEAPVTWTYLRGAEPGDPATNLNFTVEWDDVPQQFFKVIVTDGEPTAK